MFPSGASRSGETTYGFEVEMSSVSEQKKMTNLPDELKPSGVGRSRSILLRQRVVEPAAESRAVRLPLFLCPRGGKHQDWGFSIAALAFCVDEELEGLVC